MPKGNFFIPDPINEPILNYAKGSKEREELLAKYKEMYKQKIDAPMYIGSEKVYTDKKIAMTCPHDHKHVLGHFSEGDASHVKKAIDAALEAKKSWEDISWENRATIGQRYF
jgi:1-pyrroline-5-carboxylate dehydrogenase